MKFNCRIGHMASQITLWPFSRVVAKFTLSVLLYVFLNNRSFADEVRLVGSGRDRGRIPSEAERHEADMYVRRKRVQDTLARVEKRKDLEREYLKSISIDSLEIMKLRDSSRASSSSSSSSSSSTSTSTSSSGGDVLMGGGNHLFNSKTHQGSILSQAICGIREKSTGLIRPHKVILVVSIDYLPIFFNWMLFYLHICPNRENLFIICINKETSKEMSKYGISCSYSYDSPNSNVKSTVFDRHKVSSEDPSSGSNVAATGLLPTSTNVQSSGHAIIWKVRVSLAKQLLEQNVDVLICDIDAFWIRNPYPSIQLSESDITASRAKFPSNIYYKFGASLCMGFVYIRANPVTLSLWNVFYKHMLISELSDDQEILNQLIFIRGQAVFPEKHNNPITISQRMSNETAAPNKALVTSTNNHAPNLKVLEFESSTSCDTGTFYFKRNKSTITLLAQSEFMRSCNSYKEVLNTAIVAHCYAPKKGLTKETLFRYFKTWIIVSSNSEISNGSDKVEPLRNKWPPRNLEDYLLSIYSKKLHEETMYYMNYMRADH